MALKKQTIRGLEKIQLNGKPTTKEELITLSESWARNEEALFAIKREMERTPGLKVTVAQIVDDSIMDSL